MKYLIARDNGQLHRIDAAIADFHNLPPSRQLQRRFLLDALKREKAQLMSDFRNLSRDRRILRDAA